MNDMSEPSSDNSGVDDMIDFAYYSLRRSEQTRLNHMKRLGVAARGVMKLQSRAILGVEFFVAGHLWRRRNCGVLFVGHLPPQFREELDTSVGLGILALGREDRIAALRGRHPYLPLSLPGAALVTCLDNSTEVKPLNILRWSRAIERFLRRTRPKLIVITASYTPVIRLAGYTAHSLGIPVALYPHGHSRPEYWVDIDGGLTNRWLCWTPLDVAGFQRAGISPEAISLIGPLRSRVHTAESAFVSRDARICWMGVRYRPPGYIGAVHRLSAACEALGLTFMYRPHPLEDFEDVSMAGLGHYIRDFRAPIEQTIRDADVVVGLESTALLEARLAGRLVLQIRDLGALAGFDFVDLSPTIAHATVSAEKACELLGEPEEMLRLLRDGQEAIPTDPWKRLSEFVESLPDPWIQEARA